MARYHLTDAGPMKCSAQIQCPLQKKAIENGEDPNQIFHYENKAAANEAYSEKLAVNHIEDVHTGLKKHKSVSMVDISDEISDSYLEKGLFTGNRVSGHIDVDSLTEESYKDFGFEKPNPEKIFKIIQTQKANQRFTKDENGLPVFPSMALSKEEMDKIPERSRGIFQCYTGNDYKWINHALFEPKFIDTMDESIPEDSVFKNSKEGQFLPIDTYNGFVTYYQPEEDDISKELLKDIVSDMDESFTKISKCQKIVYRGARNETKHLEGAFYNAKPFDMNKWVDEFRSVGTVVEYPGYMSTTYALAEISGFAQYAFDKDNKGNKIEHMTFYEIMTPEGAPVSSTSFISSEDEVVLPRDQRYVVVGKHTTGMVKDVVPRFYTVIQMIAVDKDNNILDGTNSPVPKPLEV